jgi:hypothetical protein
MGILLNPEIVGKTMPNRTLGGSVGEFADTVGIAI